MYHFRGAFFGMRRDNEGLFFLVFWGGVFFGHFARMCVCVRARTYNYIHCHIIKFGNESIENVYVSIL